jgi:hypothetical protein
LKLLRYFPQMRCKRMFFLLAVLVVGEFAYNPTLAGELVPGGPLQPYRRLPAPQPPVPARPTSAPPRAKVTAPQPAKIQAPRPPPQTAPASDVGVKF